MSAVFSEDGNLYLPPEGIQAQGLLDKGGQLFNDQHRIDGLEKLGQHFLRNGIGPDFL